MMLQVRPPDSPFARTFVRLRVYLEAKTEAALKSLSKSARDKSLGRHNRR